MFRKLGSNGETIVEVLIAIAVLSAALGAGFAISTRSQKTVQSNQERYQAQLIANQQADLIKQALTDGGKEALLTDTSNLNKVFCMSADGTPQPRTDSASLDPDCLIPNASPKGFDYKVKIQPVQLVVGDPVNMYVITVEWDSVIDPSGTDSVRLVYGI